MIHLVVAANCKEDRNASDSLIHIHRIQTINIYPTLVLLINLNLLGERVRQKKGLCERISGKQEETIYKWERQRVTNLKVELFYLLRPSIEGRLACQFRER